MNLEACFSPHPQLQPRTRRHNDCLMAQQPNELPPTTHMCVPVPEIKDHLMFPPARTEQAGGLQDGDLERSDGGVRVRGVREGALTQQKSLLLISCPVLGHPALISCFSWKKVARPGVASGLRPSARPTRRFVPRVFVVCSPPTKPRSRSRVSVASCSCHARGRILSGRERCCRYTDERY